MIDLGVVGCGARGVAHLALFGARPDCEVLMAADVRDDLFASIPPARAPKVYCADANTILENPMIDAVVIAAPSADHYRLVRKALLFDKHVLCEPPLALHADQAHELTDIAERQGRTLMVGYDCLFHPGVRKLREYVCFGECGTIRSMQSMRTRPNSLPAGSCVEHELAAHDLALFSHLLDAQPESVRARSEPAGNCGVAASITLSYPGGVRVSLHAAVHAGRNTRRITVVGSRKTLTWDEYEPGSAVRVFDADNRPGRPEPVAVVDPLAAQAKHFLTCIARRQRPLTDGRYGAQVVTATEAIRHSIQQTGAPVGTIASKSH